MVGISVLMGVLCRRFCKVDGKGYIITNKESVFKVNYTRKVQHLAAYLIPLILTTPPGIVVVHTKEQSNHRRGMLIVGCLLY